MGGRIFHQTHWLPTLQMQGSLSEVKLDVRHSDGHTIPMMLNAIRRVTEAGSYDEVSMVVAEERNKYERELLAARKRADELVTKEREAQAALKVTQARLRQALRLGNLFLWDVDAATGTRRYEDDVARLLGLRLAAARERRALCRGGRAGRPGERAPRHGLRAGPDRGGLQLHLPARRRRRRPADRRVHGTGLLQRGRHAGLFRRRAERHHRSRPASARGPTTGRCSQSRWWAS